MIFIKVLQINSVCGVGSTGKIANGIADNLIKNGHICAIAYSRDFGGTNAIPVKINSKLGNYADAFMTRIFDNCGFNSVSATKKLIKYMDEFEPDIIQLHNLHGYYINVSILFNYIRKKEIPVVWTLHDCHLFTGHCAYFIMSGCEKWKTGCHNCESKNEYPGSVIFDRSEKNYNEKKQLYSEYSKLTLITPSKWLKKQSVKSMLKNRETIVIPNGIDLDIFRPADGSFRTDYGLAGKKIILGVSGRWNKRKGIDYFNRLADDLDDSFRVVLVGNSDGKKISKKAIHIKNTRNQTELAKIYSAADIFVNPTLEDNFPTVNIEALACGTPVITFDSGGSGEAVDNLCGSVVKTGDYHMLKKAVMSVNKNATACIEKARLYDKNIQYGKYLELYGGILSEEIKH